MLFYLAVSMRILPEYPNSYPNPTRKNQTKIQIEVANIWMSIELGNIRKLLNPNWYPNITEHMYTNPIFLVYFSHFIQNIYIDVKHGSRSNNIHIIMDKMIYYSLKIHVILIVSCINKYCIQNLKITTRLASFYFQSLIPNYINRPTN